jgi:hypothetical protein
VAQGRARLAQMLERMPEDDGRPRSGPLIEVSQLYPPHIEGEMSRLVALLEAYRDAPPGYERVQ